LSFAFEYLRGDEDNVLSFRIVRVPTAQTSHIDCHRRIERDSVLSMMAVTAYLAICKGGYELKIVAFIAVSCCCLLLNNIDCKKMISDVAKMW
jgi:hypothetical protein